MNSRSSLNTEAAILARVINCGEGKLSAAAAEFWLSRRFGEQDIARMNELSEWARLGSIDRAGTS
jgi:hypothetical protein